jgi:hypothetical protein
MPYGKLNPGSKYESVKKKHAKMVKSNLKVIRK